MLPEGIRPSYSNSQETHTPPQERPASVPKGTTGPQGGRRSFPTSAAPDVVTGWEKMPPQAEKLLKLLGKLTFYYTSKANLGPDPE